MSTDVLDPPKKILKKKGRTVGSGQPCRNWVVAAKTPVRGLDAVIDQMLAANRYRNKLCELERTRRKKCEELIRRVAPRIEVLDREVLEAELAYEATQNEIKARNKKARQRVKSPELRQLAKEQKQLLAQARAELKSLRDETYANPDVEADLKRISDEHQASIREARKHCGLYSGTYQAVEDAARNMGKGSPPEFRKFDGNGRVSVQIVGGVRWSQIESGSKSQTLLQLAPPEAKRPNWVLLHFRVKSEWKNGPPVWCVLPIRLTRPIPEDALIKRVTIHRRVTGKEFWLHGRRHRHGGKVDWSVMLTLQRPEWPKDPKSSSQGVVAVNFGFRRVENGLRVAQSEGFEGSPLVDPENEPEQTLVIPQAWLDRLDKADSIQSYRDQAIDEIRTRLLGFKQRAEGDLSLPDWWREQAKNLHLWKSAAGFAALIIRWRYNRFPGDGHVFPIAEAWRRRDSHLGRYINGLRNRFQTRRTNLFRKWVVKLRRKYQTLVIGTLNLAKLKEKPCPEADDKQLVAAQREALHRASIGELRDCLRHSMTKTIELDSAYTTQTCNVCRKRELFNAAKAIWHTCSQCGASWDQDSNNCENLLQAYEQRLHGENPEDACESDSETT